MVVAGGIAKTWSSTRATIAQSFGEAELRARAQTDVGRGRRHHLNRTPNIAEPPGVDAGLRVAERPLGVQAAGLQSASPPQPYLERRPIEHHPHAAEGPDIAVTE